MTYKVLDLFAGAGGLSLGFLQTGRFVIVAAAENNENAKKTYLRNHKQKNRIEDKIQDEIQDEIEMIDNVIGYDFRALKEKFDGIDVVIGGPPCQGFSNANRQKNHIISMNNSLVKQYFRAIKEIEPIAFVMENVSMLESSTHLFYDSYIDHDEITALNIDMNDDEIIIAKRPFKGLDLLHILKDAVLLEQLELPLKLYRGLNVLYKNRNNPERLSIYIQKNAGAIIKQISEYLDQSTENKYISFSVAHLERIKGGLEKSEDLQCYVDRLAEFMDFQKSLRSAREIYDNQIICNFQREEATGHIVGHVKSYPVIDYINAVLGESYKQKGATINATWFGVPQERKRHIIIGVRADKIRDKHIQLPTQPDQIPHVTVADAIFDLIPYEVSYSKDEIPILMRPIEEGTSSYAIELRNSEFLHNHIATSTTDEAMKRFKALEEGQNFHNLKNSLKTSYANPERTQNTIYLRLDSQKPSGTVVNVRKSMWIHPRLDRAVSIREAARLQSFPDDFVFCGTKDSQYQQVGNAVPPKMAKSIAECLLKILD